VVLVFPSPLLSQSGKLNLRWQHVCNVVTAEHERLVSQITDTPYSVLDQNMSAETVEWRTGVVGH